VAVGWAGANSGNPTIPAHPSGGQSSKSPDFVLNGRLVRRPADELTVRSTLIYVSAPSRLGVKERKETPRRIGVAAQVARRQTLNGRPRQGPEAGRERAVAGGGTALGQANKRQGGVRHSTGCHMRFVQALTTAKPCRAKRRPLLAVNRDGPGRHRSTCFEGGSHCHDFVPATCQKPALALLMHENLDS